MATYTYTARDNNGNAVSGTLSAASVDEVTAALRREGKYPISVHLGGETPAASTSTSSGGMPVGARGIKIARADVVQISTQLAIMVETGVTLSEALECIAAQSEKSRVKELLEDV